MSHAEARGCSTGRLSFTMGALLTPAAGCGGPGPVGPGNPFGVQSVALVAAADVAEFPLGGTWRLVALQLLPTGGTPEPAPSTSGSMTADERGHLHIELVCAAEVGYLCDGPGEVMAWDYPAAQVDGPSLLLCQAPPDQRCDTVAWAQDGTRLRLVGLAGAEWGFEQ